MEKNKYSFVPSTMLTRASACYVEPERVSCRISRELRHPVCNGLTANLFYRCFLRLLRLLVGGISLRPSPRRIAHGTQDIWTSNAFTSLILLV